MKRWKILVGVLLVIVPAIAFADYYFNPRPISNFGEIQLAATTATLIPAAHTLGRSSVSIQNLDSATVYCGGDSSVTNTHFGISIVASSQVNLALSYNGGSNGKVYCYSVAGMSAASLHYWEIQ